MPCGCKKGSGMYVRGGGMTKRKKRRRKGRKGSGFAEAMFNPFGAAMRGLVGGIRRRGGLGRKRGSGRAKFLSGVTWQGYGKKGSGMGFSGAGMSWTGSGLRGKRMLYRQGSGRRVV